MDELTLKQLQFGYNTCLKYVNDIVELTERMHGTNEQIFINFLDDLNEISIKY